MHVEPVSPPGEDHSKTVRDTLSTNVVIDMSARIGYLLTRFFIPPFVLAHVGLDAYGLWSTAFILVSYLGVSTLGISNVYIKFVAEYSARKDYQRANALLSTGLMVTTPLCSALFVLLYFGWPRLVEYLNVPAPLQTDAQEVVLLVVAIFLSSIAFSGFRDALTGVQKLAVVQTSWMIAYLVETALIFILIGAGRGIRGLAEAFLIRILLEILLAAFFAFRRLPWLKISISLFDRPSLHLLFSFGGVVQLLSLVSIILNSIERALAAPLVGLESAGLLDIGKKLPNMASSVPHAFAASLVPAASYLQGGLDGKPEEQEKARKLYVKGARYMNLATAFVCGLLATAPLPLLDVWLGKRYPGTAFLMVVFCLSTQAHLMTGPGTSILKGLGRPKEEMHYIIPNLVAVVIFLAVSYLLVGWTTFGIAVSVSAAKIVSVVYFIRRSNRLLGVSDGSYLRSVALPGIAPYLIGLVLSLPVHLAQAHVSRWTLALFLLALGLAYSLAVLLVVDRWVFESGERLWFHAVIQDRVGRWRPSLRLNAKEG